MTPRPQTMKNLVALGALALAGTLLSGCSGATGQVAEPSAAQPDAQSTAAPGPDTTSSPDPDGFPTCDEVKAALGPAVAGLIELDGSDNGVNTDAAVPYLGCAWHTPETDGSNPNLEEYGGISVGIERDPEYTEESMEPLGWTVDDPRVSAAGAWALKVGGFYDPADQLDVTGVQVVRDGVVVILTSGGVVLQDVPQLASLTNEWALGAGLAVLELME